MSNKKMTITFILIATLSLLGILGFTIAYFTSSTDFENEFQTGLYQTTATEVFESPENWMPGDTTPKELTVTNTGNVDVKARVCISEKWISSNDDTLPNVVNGQSMAIINLDNTEDWTKNGNCYEYNEVLEPNDTTSSFIQSVTFNSNAEADLECTTTTNNGTTTKTCTSSGDGYDNATYKLTLRVETVQANKASELWPEIIQYVNRQTDNQITTGDEISIAGEHFYVVSSDQNETVLLAKYNLLVGNVYEQVESTWTYIKSLSESDAGYGLQNETAKGYVNDSTHRIGTVAFSGTNYWDNSVYECIGTSCSTTGTIGLLSEYSQNGETYSTYSSNPHNIDYPSVYRSNIGNTIAPNYAYGSPWGYVQNNGYTIAYYVEGYKDKLIELGAPSTIVGRLLTYEEGQTTIKNGSTNPLKSHLYDSTYWLGSASSSDLVWNVRSGGGWVANSFSSDSGRGVRPAIVLRTSDI